MEPSGINEWMQWAREKGLAFALAFGMLYWVIANYVQPDLEEKRQNAEAFRKATDAIAEQSKLQTKSMENQTALIGAVAETVKNQAKALETLEKNSAETMRILIQIRDRPGSM